MDKGLHFLSGMPRSGSTLLGAILRQNPNIHAGMSSPVGGLFQRTLGAMGSQSEFSTLITEAQRVNVLRAMFHGYYQEIHRDKLVIDTNRLWCSKMAAIAQLFPEARVIVCVRELAWIMDSFERILRKNPLVTSRMFKRGAGATIYTRVGALGAPTGTVGFAWNAVQEAFYGEHADRLIVVDYEALTRDPPSAMELIYDALGLPRFAHDFDNVAYDGGAEFDLQLGVPGLHTVTGKVAYVERATILPPDLVERFSGRNFWRRQGANRRNVKVLLPPPKEGRPSIPAPPMRMPQGRMRPPAGV